MSGHVCLSVEVGLYEPAFVTVFEGKCVGVSECVTASVHKFQCTCE